MRWVCGHFYGESDGHLEKGRRGGKEGGREKKTEMGWRDGPIEKNDVMRSSAAVACWLAAWEWESSKLPGSRIKRERDTSAS